MVPSDPRGGSRVHDFHPPISASGLFWTIPIPPETCTFGDDGASASVDVKNLFVVDQPNFPDRTPTTPGLLVSMRVTWKAVARHERFGDAQKQFAFEGRRAEAQIAFAVTVPSRDFTWNSDPIETSRARFALIGRESNGRYYPTRMPKLVGLKENVAKAILGNANLTNIVVAYQGHEALGNDYKHDLTAAVVTATEPASDNIIQADTQIVLHVRG